MILVPPRMCALDFTGPRPIRWESFPSPFPDGSSPSLREDTRTSPTGLGELASDEARVNAIPGPEPRHTPSSLRHSRHSGFLESSVFPAPDPEPLISGLGKAPVRSSGCPRLGSGWARGLNPSSGDFCERQRSVVSNRTGAEAAPPGTEA